MPEVLLVVAAVFALVNGVNDGGTLVATGLKVGTLGVVTAAAALALSLAVVPLLLGTRVADTLALRLVALEGGAGQQALLAAVVAAVGVVVVLSLRGLPTSLTLATIGGITGAGLGTGQPVALGTVGFVLALAAVAPLLGGLVAFGLALASRHGTPRQGAGRMVRLLHRIGFGLLAIAYGANDGQKMLAVAALALGLGGRSWPVPTVLVSLALLFLLGTLVGVRRMAGTVSTGVLPSRPLNAVTAELSAGGTVLITGLFGAPVSMTQAITGALVGCGVTEGRHRVRWRAVLEVGAAWVVTLPAALLVAVLLGAALARIG